MSATIIIILSLGIIYVIVDTIRESQRKKWYIKGYVEAGNKWDTQEQRTDLRKNEAEDSFDYEHGFHYD